VTDRNENRPGYKKTKAGWIPEDWKCVLLSTTLNKIIDYRGKAPNKSESGIQLITARNIRKGHIDLNISKEFILETEYKNWMRRGIPQAGDVLFTTEAPLGNVALFPDHGLYALAQRVVTLRANKKILNGKYLLYYLLSTRGYHTISRLSTGSTALGIKQKTLKTISLLLPPLFEQNKITEILSTWDNAIEQTRNLIDVKKRRKKALMQQLLTGKTKPKGFEKDCWEIVSLGKLVSPVSRPVPKPDKTYLSIGLRSHCKGTFHKFIDKPEKIMMDTLYRVEPEDLILNITFAWEGAIAFATEDDSGGLVSHRFPTFRLKTKNADIEFVRNLILTKRFIWDLGLISPGGAGRNRVMNKKDFLKIKVYVPSIKSQIKIGQVLSTADNEINQLEKKLKALEKQKHGLMQKLLTGEMRVKVNDKVNHVEDDS